MSETVIGMIFGWTMMSGMRNWSACNHSVHLITEIIVPDDTLLPKLMRGEVRVKDVENQYG
jgi:hypothetical protein